MRIKATLILLALLAIPLISTASDEAKQDILSAAKKGHFKSVITEQLIRTALIESYGVPSSAFSGGDCRNVVGKMLMDSFKFQESGVSARVQDQLAGIRNWCPANVGLFDLFKKKDSAQNSDSHPITSALSLLLEEFSVAVEERRTTLKLQAEEDERIREIERKEAAEIARLEKERIDAEEKQQQEAEQALATEKQQAIASCTATSPYRRHAAAGMMVRYIMLVSALGQTARAIGENDAQEWERIYIKSGGNAQNIPAVIKEAQTPNPCIHLGVKNTIDEPIPSALNW